MTIIFVLILVAYLFIILRDIWCLSSFIDNTYLKRSRKKAKRELFKPWSTVGCCLLQRISAIQILIESSEWRAERFKREANPIKEDNFELEEIEYNGNAGGEAFYLKIAQVIHEKFRAEACALITFDELSDDPMIIRISTFNKTRKVSQHLERALQFFFRPVFSQGESWQFGLRDGYRSTSAFGEFSTFGYRYSLSYPFLICDDNGVETKGVIWLGYKSDRPPLKEEDIWLRQLASDLQHRFKSTRKILELSTKVASARRSDDERRQFMAHASHDIRSPLNNLKAILNLYALEEVTETSKELIEAALNSCNQMGEIVDDILDFSKHQSGQLRADIQAIDLSKCLIEVVDLHKVAAKLKGLNFIVSDNIAPSVIKGDKLQIKRVLNNLISNAIKYTKSGSVSINLKSSDGYVTLAIEDSGVGISDTDKARLFSPFTRFGNSAEDGVGLGLALSKILVDLNNGSLDVASELGRGSCFSVTFALCGQFEKVPSDRAIMHSNLIPREKSFGTVLLVDDDPRYVDTLSRNFVRIGVSVTRCHSAADAISIINFEAPAAVISDLNMPDGGGRQIASFIKQSGLEIPLLLLSGYVDNHEIDALKAIGAKEIFLKNVAFSQIHEWLLRNIISPEQATEQRVEQVDALAS